MLTKYLNYQLEEESDRKPFKLCASVGKLITSWQPATSGNFYGLKTMQIAESWSFYLLGTLIIAEYGTTTEPLTNIAIFWGLKLLSCYCKLKSHRIKKYRKLPLVLWAWRYCKLPEVIQHICSQQLKKLLSVQTIQEALKNNAPVVGLTYECQAHPACSTATGHLGVNPLQLPTFHPPVQLRFTSQCS